MILVDTNVVSEPWKPAPDGRVVVWIDAQAVDTLFLSTVTVAELRFGIAAMPAGKRRETLHRRLHSDVLPVFEGRILSSIFAPPRPMPKLRPRRRSRVGRSARRTDTSPRRRWRTASRSPRVTRGHSRRRV